MDDHSSDECTDTESECSSETESECYGDAEFLIDDNISVSSEIEHSAQVGDEDSSDFCETERCPQTEYLAGETECSALRSMDDNSETAQLEDCSSVTECSAETSRKRYLRDTTVSLPKRTRSRLKTRMVIDDSDSDDSYCCGESSSSSCGKYTVE